MRKRLQTAWAWLARQPWDTVAVGLFGALFFGFVFVLVVMGVVLAALYGDQLGVVLSNLGDWRFWTRRIPFTTNQTYSDAIRNILLGAAGVAGVLAGLYNLYNATRRTRIAAREADTNDRNEKTERFVECVKLLATGLGEPDNRNDEKGMAARLGAIYALERLAKDSPADTPAIVETLAAFVRERTAKFYPKALEQAEAFARAVEAEIAGEEASAETDDVAPPEEDQDQRHPDPPKRPHTDVAAAVTVLSRLWGRNDVWPRPFHKPEKRWDAHAPDLRRTVLNGLEMPAGAAMQKWKIDKAVIQEADLSWCDLYGASFGDSFLVTCKFFQALSSQANFVNAIIAHSNLIETNLSGSYFVNGKIIKCNISGADLGDTLYLSSQQLKSSWFISYLFPKNFHFGEDVLLNSSLNEDDLMYICF